LHRSIGSVPTSRSRVDQGIRAINVGAPEAIRSQIDVSALARVPIDSVENSVIRVAVKYLGLRAGIAAIPDVDVVEVRIHRNAATARYRWCCQNRRSWQSLCRPSSEEQE